MEDVDGLEDIGAASTSAAVIATIAWIAAGSARCVKEITVCIALKRTLWKAIAEK